MAGDLVGAFKDLSECIFLFREFNQLERLAESLVLRCELMLVSTRSCLMLVSTRRWSCVASSCSCLLGRVRGGVLTYADVC
jgi:hypothetical protein